MQTSRNEFDTVAGDRAMSLHASTALASFADRVHARRPDLPPALRKLVELIEEDPAQLVDGTITSLAGQAGVAASAVTRLSRSLGYPSVARMRMDVMREADLSDSDESWARGIGQGFAPGDSAPVLLEKLTYAYLATIRSTAAQLDLDAMQRVAERIASADRVDLYAIGGSANAATMFAGRSFRIGVQARVWDEVHEGLVSASYLGEQSVAIAVSTSGRTPEVVDMIREASRAGALTVAMVAQPGSPVAAAADLTITTMASGHPEHGDLTSRYGQGFALDLLFLLLSRLDATTTSRRFESTSRTVERHRREWDTSRRHDTDH